MKTFALLLVLCGLACSRAPVPAPPSLADQHARVDELLQLGRLPEAEGQLDSMWQTLLHSQGLSARIRGQALQDVAFRLGKVMLDERKPAEALEVCTRGLALGEHDDLFTANLLILRGNVQQELGKSLAAAEDFHQALVINEKLLQKVLHP